MFESSIRIAFRRALLFRETGFPQGPRSSVLSLVAAPGFSHRAHTNNAGRPGGYSRRLAAARTERPWLPDRPTSLA